MLNASISQLLLFVFTCVARTDSVSAFGFPLQPYHPYMGSYSMPQNFYGGYGYPMNYYQPPEPQYSMQNYNDPLSISNAPYSPITILQSQTNTAKLNTSQGDPINVLMSVPPPPPPRPPAPIPPPPTKIRLPCVPLPFSQCTGHFKHHPACQNICDP